MTEKNRRLPALLLGAATAVLAVCAAILLRPAPPADVRWAPAGEGAAYRLDLNAAEAAELEDLPGIGPALAERILARRDELGAFRSREDVLSVPGIGDVTYEKIVPYITYGDEVTP